MAYSYSLKNHKDGATECTLKDVENTIETLVGQVRSQNPNDQAHLIAKILKALETLQKDYYAQCAKKCRKDLLQIPGLEDSFGGDFCMMEETNNSLCSNSSPAKVSIIKEAMELKTKHTDSKDTLCCLQQQVARVDVILKSEHEKIADLQAQLQICKDKLEEEKLKNLKYKTEVGQPKKYFD